MTANTTFDIVKFMEDNPITKLSVPYQSRLINKIKHVFTEEEQCIYLTSFYCYLQYNPSNEYVVNLDDIWEWIGFSTKGNAKRSLKKYFTEGIDFITKPLIPRDKQSNCTILSPGESLIPKDKQSSASIDVGGHNKEDIFVTINTFKRLCMRAETKKAYELHEYYLKLENILQELIDEESSELRQQLAQQTQRLISTEHALKAEKDKCAKIQKKKCHEHELGETVYIYKNNVRDKNETLFKIGKSTNLAKREGDYICHNITGEIVYARRCLNSELLEKVCHHMLDKYRVLSTREWFDVSLDVLKQVMDSAHLFLDGFINDIESVIDAGLYASLEAILNNDSQSNCEKPPAQEKPNLYAALDEKKEREKQELVEKFDSSIVCPENPLNFPKFIEDFCEVGDDSFFALKADLHGAHKLWSRNAEAGTKKSLYEYLEDNFKPGKRDFSEYDAKLAVYYGIKLKPFAFTPKNPQQPTDIERYIIENCKVGFTYRVPFRAVFEDYEKWKQRQMPGYTIQTKMKDEIRNYLSTHFFPKGVYLSGELSDIDKGKTNGFGVWGITLNNDNSNTGIKLAGKLKKSVAQVNIITKAIAKVFDSVTQAGKECGVTPASISTDIKFKRVRDGHIFMFLKDYNTPETSRLQLEPPLHKA